MTGTEQIMVAVAVVLVGPLCVFTIWLMYLDVIEATREERDRRRRRKFGPWGDQSTNPEWHWVWDRKTQTYKDDA